MQFKGIISIILLSSFLTGCASIVGQSIFPVTINSNPTGANITVSDEHGLVMLNGVTPTTMTLQAGESYFHAKTYQIKFSKLGYGDQTVLLKADLDGWYFGNILFGGLIGILMVDPITGKMWKLPPYAIGNLSPMATGPGAAEPAAIAPAVVAPAAVAPASVPPVVGTQPNAGAATQGNGGVITGTKASLEKDSHVLRIVSLDQVPEDMRDKMVRIN